MATMERSISDNEAYFGWLRTCFTLLAGRDPRIANTAPARGSPNCAVSITSKNGFDIVIV